MIRLVSGYPSKPYHISTREAVEQTCEVFCNSSLPKASVRGIRLPADGQCRNLGINAPLPRVLQALTSWERTLCTRAINNGVPLRDVA